MAERRPKHPGLERVLGTSALFSTAYGDVGSSIYYALGLVAVFALGMTPIVFVITGIIFLLTAFTYSEATAMYPEAGGASSFARHAFNEFWSYFSALGQLLTYVITVSISAFFVPHYLGVFWGPLRSAPFDILAGILIVVALATINFFGVKEAARLNVFLAVTDFFTQVALVIVGAVLVFSPHTLINNIHFGTAPSLSNFLIAIPIGMVAYTGIETISNMSEETRDYERTVPKAIKLVVMAVFTIYAALPSIALSAMPVVCKQGKCTTTLASTYAGDPILGIVKNLNLGFLQKPGEIYVGLLAATILLIAANAGTIGVSRLTYSMGIHRQLPDRIRKIHPRYRTPYIAIMIFALIAILTILPGQAEFLGKMYSFSAMISFTMAHVSVIGLRIKHPDVRRPYKAPWAINIRGKEVPLLAVFGALGTGGAWVGITVLNPGVSFIGVGWFVLGLIAYLVYRRKVGLRLTETAKISIPSPVVEREVEYNSVLLAFDNLNYSRQAVGTAIKLAARKRRGIHVVVTILVPLNLPPNARLEIQEREAATILEDARFVGGRRVTGEVVKVRSGEAGDRLAQIARDISAEVVVIPLPKWRGSFVFDQTVETLLELRPCRIIIDSSASEKAA